MQPNAYSLQPVLHTKIPLKEFISASQGVVQVEGVEACPH